MPIIKVENLSKKYVLSHQQRESYTALRDVVANKFKGLGRKILHPFTSHPSPFTDSSKEDFYALNDVSFNIEKGDRVGIIGRNGAGKSTLLKVLSRITEPSSGRVSIRGRVASLLEVGTGFHPELTGRENIYLNGAILGMARFEIKRKFDEIVEFAEVEKFLDTPVKHYSSGMYVRLAFAVAAHLEPEILLVDEVLAVGDASFQKKCLGKMEDVSKSEGRTILFVSHNLTAIQNLCSKALYLDKGMTIGIGESHHVIEHYLSDVISTTNLIWEGEHKVNDFLKLEYIKIVKQNPISDRLFINEDIQLDISLDVFKNINDIAFELFVYTIEGTPAFSSFSDPITLAKGNFLATCIIPKNLMNNGHYIITVGISQNNLNFIVKIDGALTIDLLNNPEGLGWQGDWPGVVRPELNWNINKY
jgi:lipopolysaccharide transport system ATP-binding protein